MCYIARIHVLAIFQTEKLVSPPFQNVQKFFCKPGFNITVKPKRQLYREILFNIRNRTPSLSPTSRQVLLLQSLFIYFPAKNVLYVRSWAKNRAPTLIMQKVYTIHMFINNNCQLGTTNVMHSFSVLKYEGSVLP